MPRKRSEKKHITYCMPAGAKEIIDSLVDASPAYINKPVWKQKFYHLADYVTDQNTSRELDPSIEYVNLNETISAKILGVNNQEIANILRDTISSGLFMCDGISYRATTAQKGKKTVFLTEGKSRGFQFRQWNPIKEVTVIDCRSTYERTFINSKKMLLNHDKSLRDYNEVLTRIKIDESDVEECLSKTFKEKRKKKSQKENYRRLIKNFKNNIRPNNNIQCTYIPLVGAFVPIKDLEVFSMVPSYLDKNKHGAFVPCTPAIFEIRRFNDLGSDEIKAITARCNRSKFIINGGYVLPTRPNKGSRVYNAITNLKRELRKAIRLDGKKIVGLDISNSQPLIATILLREYWMNKAGYLPDDVRQYQADCETGQFYNNFMRIIDVPYDLRPLFKENFFAMVFFGEVKEWSHVLKDLFVDRYPNCWEAICELKGEPRTNDYKRFSKRLQKKEAEIIFDRINMGLIRQGILAFNIFDSIYVNNRHDFEIAKQLTKEAFNEYGLNPTLKLEYEEHLAENEMMEMEEKSLSAALTQRERYVSSTNNDLDKPNTLVQVTKLQHLKIGEKNETKMEQIEKFWLSIQDDDLEIEPVPDVAVMSTTKQPYKFVNPYVNRSA